MAASENMAFIKALNPATTALVVIDLQNGIVGLPLAPRTGPETVAAVKQLAQKCRAAKAPIVWVHVGWSADFGDALKQPVDKPSHRAGPLPGNWSSLVEDTAQPGDLTILKRQWGAFHATELDMQLRRRGIKTIVLCGIATNMGVESTARQAWEHGYHLITVEDACSSLSADAHAFAIGEILPRIGIVATVADIAFAG